MNKEQLVNDLKSRTTAPVLVEGDDGYDESRSIWNGMIDKKPSIVVRASGAADVASAVNFARENEMLLAVKGGGHGVAGKAVCDDGLLIDLADMNDVRVDLSNRTVRAGGGATLGDLDHETQKFALAVPAGVVSETGIAGLTLGGGIGYLSRKHGLTLDNLVSADVVLADGSIVEASESSEPDLFWALRGGGGNFGVVTSFVYKAHPLGPEVMTCLCYYDFENAGDVFRFYREYADSAPDEVAAYLFAAKVPPAPHFPEEYVGKPCVIIHSCYAGPVEEGRKALKPIADFGDPFFKAFAPMKFTDLQQAFNPGVPHGKRYYWKAVNLAKIEDGLVDVVTEFCSSIPGEYVLIGIEPLGGAINRVEPGATAYPHRSAEFSFGIWSGWENAGDDGEVISWTRSLYEAAAPYGSGVYSNYVDQDEGSRASSAYGDNLRRLREVKAKYDPGNLFRGNLSVG